MSGLLRSSHPLYIYVRRKNAAHIARSEAAPEEKAERRREGEKERERRDAETRSRRSRGIRAFVNVVPLLRRAARNYVGCRYRRARGSSLGAVNPAVYTRRFPIYVLVMESAHDYIYTSCMIGIMDLRREERSLINKSA